MIKFYNFNLFCQTSTKRSSNPGCGPCRRQLMGWSAGCLLPVWVSWAALKKSEPAKTKVTWISRWTSVDLPGRTQVPELRFSSTQPSILEKIWTKASRDCFHGYTQLSQNFGLSSAQEAGGVCLPPPPSFTSGSTPSFPFQVVCPGEELMRVQGASCGKTGARRRR